MCVCSVYIWENWLMNRKCIWNRSTNKVIEISIHLQVPITVSFFPPLQWNLWILAQVRTHLERLLLCILYAAELLPLSRPSAPMNILMNTAVCSLEKAPTVSACLRGGKVVLPALLIPNVECRALKDPSQKKKRKESAISEGLMRFNNQLSEGMSLN